MSSAEGIVEVSVSGWVSGFRYQKLRILLRLKPTRNLKTSFEPETRHLKPSNQRVDSGLFY